MSQCLISAFSPKHQARGLICRFRLREGMKIDWVWHYRRTLEETVLATEIGYGSVARQEGTQPREFVKLGMCQAWLSTGMWGKGLRNTRSPMDVI